MPDYEETRQGWPGNLSPEQERKLKEFWEKLDRLTSESSDKFSLGSVNSTNTGSMSPEGKKRRFGMWRKKESDDSAAADDDKHGQMKQFQQALKDQTPEQLRATIWSMVKLDDPDGLMLRFLRARKWDVNKALIMLISTIHWRGQEVHLDDDIVPKGDEHYLALSQSADGAEKKLGNDFMAQLRQGKSYVHGLDKVGRPLCFVNVKLHKIGAHSQESLEKFIVYTIETTRMMLRAPVDTAVIVFDMTDFSMANMDYTPVKFIIKCFEANYPESLGAICVYKAPWIFSSIWSVIRGWLDPVVASKVHFTKDINELSEFISKDNIPKSLGGNEEWEYDYTEPQPNENKIMEDVKTREEIIKQRDVLVEKFEQATREWVFGRDPAASAKRRMELSKELQTNYWQLDPYVRARTVYDRQGVLLKGGGYEAYPERTGPKVEAAANSAALEKVAEAPALSTAPAAPAPAASAAPIAAAAATAATPVAAAAATTATPATHVPIKPVNVRTMPSPPPPPSSPPPPVPATIANGNTNSAVNGTAVNGAAMKPPAPAATSTLTPDLPQPNNNRVKGDDESVYYDALE